MDYDRVVFLPWRTRMRSVVVTAIVSLSAFTSFTALPGCGDATAPAPPIVQASETRVLGVKGMHCDGCVNAVTTKVSKVEGVQSCEVSLEEETATIVADPSAFANAQAAIEKLGYEVVPPAE
jgi:copper chaperone